MSSSGSQQMPGGPLALGPEVSEPEEGRSVCSGLKGSLCLQWGPSNQGCELEGWVGN